MRKVLATSITLMSLTLFPLFAETLPLDETMNKEDQQKIGLDKMSDPQKKALEEWITTWTKNVLSQSTTYHPSKTLQEWIASWPLAISPHKKGSSDEIIAQQKLLNRKVDKVKDQGSIIELKDGSIWQIAEYDTYRSKRWIRDDQIEWAPSQDVHFSYKLKNLTRSQTVMAAMKASPSETGVKTPEPEEYYAGTVKVTQVDPKGETITLEDNKSWRIAPIDQMRVKAWKVSDRIKTATSEDVIYKNILTNLDSGETVLGIPSDPH
ncbi:MAG: hypothetical protein JWO53_631 [Chlamydiia bacterium]|nr:hypothetical protein [Chlamydiia bacterium]